MKRITVEISDDNFEELRRLAYTYPSKAFQAALVELMSSVLSALRSEGKGWHPDDPEAGYLEELHK